MDLHEIEISTYFSVALSAIGFVGGAVSWALNLKIKHDILTNTTQIEKEMNSLKERLTKEINGVNDNYIRELGTVKEEITEQINKLQVLHAELIPPNQIKEMERSVTELRSNLSDRILSTVNGKYVRSEYHNQSITGLQDKLNSFKELIEISMAKIEENLDQQINDLKERIFHDK